MMIFGDGAIKRSAGISRDVIFLRRRAPRVEMKGFKEEL